MAQIHSIRNTEHNPTVLQRKDLTKYTKKVRYYSKIPLLFMDVFAINRYPKETDNILYHLVTR